MAKPNSYQSAPKANKGSYDSAGTPKEFVDRDLTNVSPNSQQFEPTEAEPVRQHYRMAGGCK